MDKQTLRHLGWITASFSLATLVAGCADMDAAESVDESAAYETTNGFSFNGFAFNGFAFNGFAFNGLAAFNGTANAHGLSTLAGLGTSTGLSSTSGLMTTPMGRRSVSYLASCALGSGQTLTKADQTGRSHQFSGSMGLAPGWLNGPPSAQDEINVSACMLARMNSAGMHVPIWIDSAAPGIGWGQNSSYPVQEGAYFGSLTRPASDGNLHAWYCEGRDYKKGLVPGRLGATGANNFFVNPWGSGALCDDHCTKYGSDGYTSCNGVSNPVTVWRQASYNPAFDDDYIYKLVNVKSKMVLDVSGGYTGENGSIIQWYDNNGSNQHWRIIQVATSQWKIISVSSGKVVTDRYGSSANVMTNSYNGTSTDNWAIDDHNGHFIIRNKATNAYLRAMDSNAASAISVTTSYSGAADTDWDLFAVDSL